MSYIEQSLSAGEKIDHKDPLHWTGLYQNWNLQCAAPPRSYPTTLG